MGRPYPTWQRRHEAVLSFLVAHPERKLVDCAAATGYSRWQLSRIVSSHGFNIRYQAAMNASFNKLIGQKVSAFDKK